MKAHVRKLALAVIFAGIPGLTFAADGGWQAEVGKALGKTGAAMPGGVYRVGLPRTDLEVTLDGIRLRPGFALGGWLAFEKVGDTGMVMGDLVLTEEEVSPVMAKLAAAGIEITALHNHLLRNRPFTMYMHVLGHGDPVKLAAAAHTALAESKTPLVAVPSPIEPPEIDFDTAAIDQALGAKGKNNGGVYQFSISRAEPVMDGGMEIPAAMGSANAINFQATGGGKAAITGDFVLIASEVNPVLRALRDHGIEVTAIHNHMLHDQPRLFFMHFWANDDAVKLAEGLKAALSQINIAKELGVFARAILLAAGLVGPAVMAQTPPAPPLVLETKIPLGEVSGRIDHLGVDVKRQRLFVAELGNDSLGVVDLASGKVRIIVGFSEPQGVAYVAPADSVYVANGGDGSVRVLRGADLAPVGRIELGDDADNVRVDAQRHHVLVGYGKGAIAVIDPATRSKVGDIRLKGHPESFQIDETGTQVFVNVPDAREITVVDLAATGSQSLPTPDAAANFPMAIDRNMHRVLVVFRHPPTLLALSSQDGHVLAQTATCGDADDVFVDARRQRVYVSCGQGVIDVFAAEKAGYRRLARIPTTSGARTSLFVPELDRLYVAVRASSGEPAAIWVFRPAP